MKVIKVIIILIVVVINISCSSNRDKGQFEMNRYKKLKDRELKREKRDLNRQSTDDLRDEQMQDYETTIREMY